MHGKAIKNSDGRPEGRARKLIELANDLLGSEPYGLPAVSISNLAAGSASSPFFFLLLVWLDAADRSGQTIKAIGDENRRLIVGAITTLAWFSERPGDCLLKLWKRLRKHEASHQLEQFFSRGMMRECLVSQDQPDRRALLPPLPPSCLKDAICLTVTGAAGFDAGEGGIWRLDQKWSRWNSLDFSTMASKWFDEIRLPEEQRVLGATQGLAGRLWGMRELLHYAQRKQLKSWFRYYDPSSPDQLEDTDRPWDYDHIFPSSYGGVNNLPHLIREWVASIGNLRIWPFEANRALGDDHPGAKLGVAIPQEGARPYCLRNGAEICIASQIDDWPLWRSTTPNGERPNPYNFLAAPRNERDKACRPALVRALSSRWIGLYDQWYTELRIIKLFE